ncbi:hypothetical protein FQN54_006540 [Arachnomyces sp. PD_36]|nr:hypothetical protein FQN54_006540 [Arachnomyces sp. PD_36]
MRIALLRLLNRPSALHLLEDLVSSPTGVQQLSSGSTQKCQYCQTHALQNDAPATDFPNPIVSPRRLPIRRVLKESREAKPKEVRTKDVENGYIRLPIGSNLDRNDSKRRPKSTKGSLHTRRYPSNPSERTSDTKSGTIANDEVEGHGARFPGSETLELKSTMTGNEPVTNCPPDVPEKQRDFAHWEELLRYHQLAAGDEGTIEVWKGLLARKSDTELQLPVEGHYADIFWQKVVEVGLRREDFLQELHEYARDRWKSAGEKWKGFYENVVGGFLKKGDQAKAVEWHGRLKDIHLSHPSEIAHVFPQAISTSSGLATFKEICKDTSGHQIYSSVLPTLYKEKRLLDAVNMHKFLVSRKDAPTRWKYVDPLMEYVRHNRPKQEYDEFHAQLVAAGILKDKPKATSKEIAIAPPKQARGEVPATNPFREPDRNKFQDSFGARLFATSSLAFEFILSGLRVFGVNAIGPLSLREMALRAENAKDISHKIDQLQEAGVSIGDSVFSRLVKKLAREGKERLLQDVLHGDQHPDVLEDWRIQESLLASYYLTGDWRQFDLTVAILKMMPEPEDSGSFNLFFRNALTVGDRKGATRLIEQMREHNIPLTHTSRISMFKKLIKHRQKGKAPGKDAESFGDLTYLLGIWQHVVQTGGYIPPNAWIEGLKRLGMADRWDDLQKLCLWLAYWYSSAPKTDQAPVWQRKRKKPVLESTKKDSRYLPPSHQDSPLRTIFNPTFLQAIIAWGFKFRVHPKFQGDQYINPYSKTNQTLIPWMRGIILVRQLKERGVLAQRPTIAKACRQRLAVLYGEHRLSSRPMNRVLREENPWKLEEVLADIEAAWGAPVFMKNELSDHHKLVNPPQSKYNSRNNGGAQSEMCE